MNSQKREKDSPSSSVRWIDKILVWSSQKACGLTGHKPMQQFEHGRTFLRCTNCGHETQGWTCPPRQYKEPS